MQPIRTYAEMPLEFDTPIDEADTYQQIKEEAWKLFAQDLSFVKFAKRLGVTDKTVRGQSKRIQFKFALLLIFLPASDT